MKCEVMRVQGEDKLGVRYGVEESEKGFILELSDEIIEEIKESTLEQVHYILNRELYKQTGIRLLT